MSWETRQVVGGRASLGGSKFAAGSSLLGYVYQCRVGLLWALRRLRAKGQTEFSILIEGLDDVVFESDAGPLELLQTKHHVRNVGDLTDASEDIWKTLRVWSEQLASETLPSDCVLYLITTAAAPSGSAASRLRASERHAVEACGQLRAVARLRGNRRNLPAYEAFLSLPFERQQWLLDSIVVLDSAPTIDQLDDEIAGELTFAAEADKRASMKERLEGWWFRRLIEHLVSPEHSPILGVEISAQIDDLREQFKRDNLPIDDDLRDAEIDFVEYQERLFVRQLGLIDVVGKSVIFAIKDFYRAYEQRSRWLREDLLLVGDLSSYEKRLQEEWERRFEVMQRHLGPDATEDAKKEAAQAVYEWVELEANVPIRPRCSEPFVTRGSFHMLADELKVGWHPDFAERLQRILDPSPTS